MKSSTGTPTKISALIDVNLCPKLFSIAIRALFQFLCVHQSASEQNVGAHDERGAHEPAFVTGRHEMPNGGGNDIDERHGQHEFPGEVHELIHTQTRERAADPDE